MMNIFINSIGEIYMKKQTDLEKLKEIFENQSEKSIKVHGYEDLSKYNIDKRFDNTFQLTLEELQIGFCFNSRGRIVGIYNWKW
jgi:hypothetical protein